MSYVALAWNIPVSGGFNSEWDFKVIGLQLGQPDRSEVAVVADDMVQCDVHVGLLPSVISNEHRPRILTQSVLEAFDLFRREQNVSDMYVGVDGNGGGSCRFDFHSKYFDDPRQVMDAFAALFEKLTGYSVVDQLEPQGLEIVSTMRRSIEAEKLIEGE
jgi:hypothetical protein